jgi:hypothetical protein
LKTAPIRHFTSENNQDGHFGTSFNHSTRHQFTPKAMTVSKFHHVSSDQGKLDYLSTSTRDFTTPGKNQVIEFDHPLNKPQPAILLDLTTSANDQGNITTFLRVSTCHFITSRMDWAG